jgi:hypothetical protein
MPAPRSPFHSTAFIRFSRRKRGYNITGLERGRRRSRSPAARQGAEQTTRSEGAAAESETPTVEFRRRDCPRAISMRDAHRALQRRIARL